MFCVKHWVVQVQNLDLFDYCLFPELKMLRVLKNAMVYHYIISKGISEVLQPMENSQH